MTAELYLILCSQCEGQAPDVGVCPRCGGAGVLDHDGELVQFLPPFDTWTPRQLVALSDASRARRLRATGHVPHSPRKETAIVKAPPEPTAASTPAPRRLTLSNVVELAFATLNRTGLDHSTVKLTRNAKGDTQIEVSVRTGEQGIDTVEQAAGKARAVYDELAAVYPMSEATAPAKPGPLKLATAKPPATRKQDGKRRGGS